MPQLFAWLTQAVENIWFIAIPAAILWGILSILLSPCHLASIPLVISFIDGQGRISAKRAFWISTLFALGILTTIAIIGVITAAAGRLAGDLGSWTNYLVAGIFFLIGLHLVGVIQIPFPGASNLKLKQKGPLTALLLGLIFGIALGPCTFAYMAPILGIAFKESAGNMTYGILLMIAYGLGHCSVIVLAGTFTEIVQRYMNWNEKSKATIVIKKTCGIAILLAGLYMLSI